MHILLEACVETVEEALNAEQHGAHRLELCANLDLDGTTPDDALIQQVLSSVHIPVKVMIRPRGGDFVYSEEEFKAMRISIEERKALGISGIVTGILHPDHTLDIERIRMLVQAAHPLPVTIHKCIDAVPDVVHAIEQLKHISGITSILSSGQAQTAMQGIDTLIRMQHACADRLMLIVAGNVTSMNIDDLHEILGAQEYHGKKIVS